MLVSDNIIWLYTNKACAAFSMVVYDFYRDLIK
jgi:hypothetical protein